MTNLVQACSIMSESLSERVMAGFSSLVLSFARPKENVLKHPKINFSLTFLAKYRCNKISF